jgi:hypothetical protein
LSACGRKRYALANVFLTYSSRNIKALSDCFIEFREQIPLTLFKLTILIQVTIASEEHEVDTLIERVTIR